MDYEYQQIWQSLWPWIAFELSLRLVSIYAIFKPVDGIFRAIDRINWSKAPIGLILSQFLKSQGGFETFDLLLIGFAPVSFLIAFFFAL